MKDWISKLLFLRILNLQSLLTNDNLDHLWDHCQEIGQSCESVLSTLSDLGLPYNVKPLWADFSDAGPGVGVSNFEVHFHDVEMA